MEKKVFSIVFKNGMELVVTKRGFCFWNGTTGGRQWVVDASCLIDDDRFEISQHTTKLECNIGNRVYKAARQKIVEAGNSTPNTRSTKARKSVGKKR